MRVYVVFASDIFVDKQILSFVVEDSVHFLGSWSADIRS